MLGSTRTSGASLRAAIVLAAVLGVVVPETTVHAAPTAAELDAAREAYRAGIALETAGNWAAALAKFQEVAAVKSTARVRFHIGYCQESLGRWTEALGAYRLAIADATQAREKDVIKEAESARARLEARIPHLTIRRGAGAESGVIVLDGVELGGSMIGAELPVDPGVHTLEVRLPGREPERITVEVKSGERKSVEVNPPAAGPVKPAVAAAPPPSAPRTPESSPQGQGTGGSKVVPWIVTGLGGASLAASGAFFYLRQKSINDLHDRCGPELQCTEADRSLYDQGRTYNTIANVALGVGVVGLGVGTVLLLTSGPDTSKEGSAGRSEEPEAGSTVGMRIHPTGVSLVGQF